MLIQVHISQLGKVFLRIVSGKLLCFTQKKEVPQQPSSFCLQLRKHLDHATILDAYQKDAERIVVLELEKQQKFLLIFELFSKGNIILTDEQFQIIGVLEQQSWKDRTVKVRERYQFPASGRNWKIVSQEELGEMLQQSNKKNLATALATELGLGGVYAEEVCLRAGVSKDLLPAEVSKEETAALLASLRQLLFLLKNPKGYVYAEGITPFMLTGKSYVDEKNTFSEAVDTMVMQEKVSPYQKKINSLQAMIEQQEQSILGLGEEIEEETKKANKMYEHYQPIQQLLQIVTEMRQEKDWTEIGEELKKESRITKVDLKNKKIVLELE